MKTKKTLSLLLCLVMLISMIAGTGAMSMSAAAAGATVSFRSPAILANVGEKIDLSKYGVEFAEGVKTTEGLTWWKEGVSGLSVSYANPALFANVGDTINFTDYDVELTKGNTVKADNLTWTQSVAQKVIPAATPYLQAEAGETVDLKYWTVEGMGASLSWKLGDTVVTEITAKAGDLLTVSDGTTTKTVIVATKDGNNYVVYENEFENADDTDSLIHTSIGGKPNQFNFSAADGVMKAVRASDYSSGSENMTVAFPEYLWGLTDFTVSFKSQFTDWKRKAGTGAGGSQKTGAYIGLFIHGDTENIRPQHLVAFNPNTDLITMTRIVADTYSKSETLKVQRKDTIANLSLKQWQAYKVKVEGSKIIAYTDFDGETLAPSGTFSKKLEYDFATEEGQTLDATTGAMGLVFFRSDSEVDDLKITVPAIEYATQDGTVSAWTYTVAEKGVFSFSVTDGTTTRVVYLVAKNAEDTEYVLYENDFSEGLNGIERAGIGGDESKFAFSVENGVFSAVRAKNYVSSVENTSLILPAHLWDFTNYSISFKAQFIDWAKKDNGTSQKATAYVGLFVHGDTTNYRPQHLVTFNPASNLQTMTRINESTYAKSETLVVKYDATIPNLSKNQWIGYKVDVEGSKVTAYTDFDATTSTMTGDFVKRVEHDFATVDGQTWNATTGAIGLAFFRSDVDVDDIKVTISAETAETSVELQEITSFTPTEAGVTPITVKCGDVEKTIYVVAKNAADTEYVLYENNFNSEEDVNDLTVVQGEADMTVADGQLTIDGKTSIGSDSDNGAYIRLPEWLGQFGDYEISAKIVRDTYKTSSEALGFFARSAEADNAESLYLVRSRFTNNVSDCIAYAQRIPGVVKPRSLTWGLRKNASIHKPETGLYNIVKMGVAGDTVTMQIIDQDEDGRADDNYVLYETEQKELRTGYIGLFITEVIVHYDYIRVTVPAVPDAPTAATFTPDADLTEGTIAGKLDVTLPGTGVEPSDVIFYWGDGEGKLAGYEGFEKILVVNNATKVSYTIPAGTVVPAGATELRVYTTNVAGESSTCVVVPLNGIAAKEDEKLFSFLVNSDWHIAAAMSASTGNPTYSTANNDAHFIQMIERFKAVDPEATQIFFGGDIVDGQKGAEAEYARLVELWNTYAQGYTFDGVLGNHEYWYNADEEAAGNTTREYTVQNFIDNMGVPMTAEKPYYSKDFNGYQFFFLNTIERDGTSRQSHNDSTLGAEQLAWLDEGLAKATANGKVAFVFHHQPITMSAEENNQITDRDALVAVLKKYPTAIFVSSHSHDELQQKSTFSLASSAMCNMVDTSAITFVIPSHYNSRNVRNMSEGYLVEMYADRVVFRGMNLMTGEWLPTAQFAFTYEEVEVQEPNTAVVDEETKVITVKADEGYELKAGSLWVEDANGNAFVPTRVGYRDGGDANQYQLPANAEAPFIIHAEFYQPGVDGAPLNMGLVGTSVNVERKGLRFIHRLNIFEQGGKLYMLSNGENVEVKEYGLLLATASILKNPEDLDIETANDSQHVKQYAWPDTNKYYDKCSEYADIAVHVTNIVTDKYDGSNVELYTRTYVKLADGTVVYGDVATSSYGAYFQD